LSEGGWREFESKEIYIPLLLEEVVVNSLPQVYRSEEKVNVGFGFRFG
jgi:hypothetical protein